MGHMDVLGIIANGFNIYFPMLMVSKVFLIYVIRELIFLIRLQFVLLLGLVLALEFSTH